MYMYKRMNIKKTIAVLCLVSSLLSTSTFSAAGNRERSNKSALKEEIDKLTFDKNDYDLSAQKKYANVCGDNQFENESSTQKNSTHAGEQFLKIAERFYGKQLPNDEKLNKLRKAFTRKKFQECMNNKRMYEIDCKIASKFDEESINLEILWNKKHELQHRRKNAEISNEQFEKKFDSLKKQFRKIPKLQRNFVWTDKKEKQYEYDFLDKIILGTVALAAGGVVIAGGLHFYSPGN